ncbi:MAG: hypothetical protein RIS82_126 [Actinomycetota bacterium]|jgi:MFS family permease
MKSHRASLVMAAGAFAYLVAVTNRSSLGVATIEATERFQVSAAQLSMLAVAQLIVYAAMQIPVGMLLDRYGARAMLAFGAITMSVGQFFVAFSEHLPMAVIGRMFLGMGDAFVFISMIRLINGWYHGGAATKRQQLLTNIGQLGQAVSAIPFASLLHLLGWTPAFGFLATLTLILVFVSLVYVRDDREGHSSHHRVESFRKVIGGLTNNIRHPGVRMAFWTHFTLQSATSVFILLWGFPFLVNGQGFSRDLASLVIASFVVMGFMVGPIISRVCSAHPELRDRLVFTGIISIGSIWSAVVFGPEQVHPFVLALLVVVLSTAAPMSMIAFDYTRAFVPKKSLGSTNGFVNIGGFLATFSMMFFAGVILDLVQAVQVANGIDQGLYSAFGFKWAMSIQFLVLGLGLGMFLLERSKLRRLSLTE